MRLGASRIGGGSSMRTRKVRTLAARNETASSTTATGAVRSWMTAPAALEPIRSVTAAVERTTAFPLTKRSRPIRRGRMAWKATSSMTTRHPEAKAMPYMSSMRRNPNADATESMAMTHAAENDVMTSTSLRLNRSAMTPANNPNSRKAALPAAPRTPISDAPALSDWMAMSGSARLVMDEPSDETKRPPQIFLNSGSLQMDLGAGN